MATSSSSVSSSSAATTFNGSSTYASDLQNAITRSVGFASLPLTLLQNQQNDLNSRQSALTSLSGQFQSVQTALDSIDRASTSQSNAVTSSTTSVASATVTAAADAATYSLSVTNIGSSTNTLSTSSLTKVSDPDKGNISSSSAFTLTVDGSAFQVSNTAGTLTGLKDAINASSANVSATIINVGGSSAPDYRLSIQGTKLASTAISLSDGTNSLLDTLSTGANAQYAVNGQTSSISSDTRSITLAPGLTVNLQQTGSTTLTVGRSASSLSNSLSAFATAYNNAFDELAKSHGTTAGPLTSDPIIYAATQALQNLHSSAGTTSTKTVNSLEDLGLSFGTDGHVTFDSSVLAAASPSTLSDAATFLGSKTTGGFLQAANNALNALDDSSKGLFIQSSQSIATSLSALGTKISDTQTRITQLQTSLTAQMDKADALIASLQQQADYFTTLFTTQRDNQVGGNG